MRRYAFSPVAQTIGDCEATCIFLAPQRSRAALRAVRLADSVFGRLCGAFPARSVW